MNHCGSPATTMRAALPMLLCWLMLGCVAAPTNPPQTSQGAAGPLVPAAVTLVDRRPDAGYEADVLCTQGGAAPMTRVKDAWVRDGHHKFEIHVDPQGTTGIQVGLQLDKQPTRWLPTVSGSPKDFDVEIPGNATESGTARWTFWFSQNVPTGTDGCYTGAGVMRESITVTARP